jgi:hypothetical protein
MWCKKKNARSKLTQCCRQLKTVPVDDFPTVSISFLHMLKFLGSQAVCCLISELKHDCVTSILSTFHEATPQALQEDSEAIQLEKEESEQELLSAQDPVKEMFLKVAFELVTADCCNFWGYLRVMMIEFLTEQPAD